MRFKILLTFLVFVLSACAAGTTTPAGDDLVRVLPYYTVIEDWVKQNPCGSLRVRPPLFNVSGELRGSKPAGSWVSLYIAPNLTRDGARFAVERCASLGRVPVDNSGSFLFPSLPVGHYVALVLVFPRDESASLEIDGGFWLDHQVVEVDSFREGSGAFVVFAVRESGSRLH